MTLPGWSIDKLTCQCTAGRQRHRRRKAHVSELDRVGASYYHYEKRLSRYPGYTNRQKKSRLPSLQINRLTLHSTSRHIHPIRSTNDTPNYDGLPTKTIPSSSSVSVPVPFSLLSLLPAHSASELGREELSEGLGSKTSFSLSLSLA